ncbi:MAG: hypothetical protein R2827_08165 [Bdellovibrionales bacterium]
MSPVEEVVDYLMEKFAVAEYISDIEQGKAAFFERAGILDEESQDYEMKMIQFAHWFLFSRPLNEKM